MKIYLAHLYNLEPEEFHPDPLLPLVEKLIEEGTGDPGRLQSIHNSLLKGKPLFHSDENYLKKLEESSLDSTLNEGDALDI